MTYSEAKFSSFSNTPLTMAQKEREVWKVAMKQWVHQIS